MLEPFRLPLQQLVLVPLVVLTSRLSNLSGVNINTSLLPNLGNNVDLGSGTRPFRDLYIYGSSGTPGTNNFRITGTSTGGTHVLTLSDLSGLVGLVQTAGSSIAQTGDLNVSGTLIAGTRLQGTLIGTADAASTSNVTLRSGNASAGNSGNVLVDAGTASATAGTVTLAGTNATGLTLGRAGLQAQVPGRLTTYLRCSTYPPVLLTARPFQLQLTLRAH